jgi:methylenetetrahydrofolate dehydrogenase (NADP+) / methenyltetrahydrofolate cyclohydrolase
MRILDGNAAARQIRDELGPRIAAFRGRVGRPPGLGIVLVGDDPASEVYVKHKVKDGTDAGMFVDLVRRPASASLDETLAVVRELNASPLHDGIIVQSPLPKAMGADAEMRVFETIDPAKDSIRRRTSTASVPSTSVAWFRTARCCARARPPV